MRNMKFNRISFPLLLPLLFLLSCGGAQKLISTDPVVPTIDLTHWKVTIPTPRTDGKPIEVSPPEILDYANIDALKEFMYPDSTDGSIVFYAYPLSSTANSKYSRSELREQMVSGENDINWKFKDGGYMKVTMSVPEVTRSMKKDEGHRVIIAQIHGKLTKEQQALIGQKDTNAPPILKVYYQDGKVEVRTKMLSINNPTEEEVLITKNWIDQEPYVFNSFVKTKKFTLEVLVSEGRLEVKLNGNESVVYDGKHMDYWGVFDNYFKAGNYLTTRDEGAYAKVKIYELEAIH